MKLRELPDSELFARCAGAGLTWRIPPFVIRIKTRLADVVRGLAFLYTEYPVVDQAGVADAEITVRGKLPWARWVSIRVDGALHYNWLRRRLVMPMVEWTINVCVFQRPHQYLMVHAGVVADGDLVAILPGQAGSGKSTLCAALLQRGWRLLSDEVALVRPADGRIQPVPRPISLKEESIDVIRQFAPDSVIGPEVSGTSKGTVAHLLPPVDSVTRAGEAASPAWVIFPVFERGGGATLSPVSKASALMRTAENAFNYSVFGRQGFDVLSVLIDRCQCYELRFGNLDDALLQLESLQSARRADSPAVT